MILCHVEWLLKIITSVCRLSNPIIKICSSRLPLHGHMNKQSQNQNRNWRTDVETGMELQILTVVGTIHVVYTFFSRQTPFPSFPWKTASLCHACWCAWKISPLVRKLSVVEPLCITIYWLWLGWCWNVADFNVWFEMWNVKRRKGIHCGVTLSLSSLRLFVNSILKCA